MEPTLTLMAAKKTSRSRLKVTIGYYLAFLALGVAIATLGPTLPGLSAQTHVSLGAISFLFVARSFGYLLGSFVGGRVYDRFSGHPVMVVLLISMAICLFVIPLVPFLWLLVVVMLLFGMGEGAVDVGCNTLIVWVHGSRVGPYLNGLHFFFGVGAFLAPLLIGQAILITGGIQWAYWLLIILILPGVFWIWRLPSPVAPVHEPDADGRSANFLLVFLSALLLFLYVGAEAGYGGWILTYAITLGLADQVAGAYLTSVFWGALTAGRLISIPLSTKFRPEMILIVDLGICLLALAALILGREIAWIVWAATILLGAGMASFFPTVVSWAERRVALTGKVLGWFLLGAGVGGMFLPWAIGQLFERVGPKMMVTVILGDLLAALAVFLFLARAARPRARQSETGGRAGIEL